MNPTHFILYRTVYRPLPSNPGDIQYFRVEFRRDGLIQARSASEALQIAKRAGHINPVIGQEAPQ